MMNAPLNFEKQAWKKARSMLELKAGLMVQVRRLLLPAGFAAVLLLSACSAAGTHAPGDPGLMVKLSFSPNHVMIDNGNDFIWTGVSIELNGNYRYTAAALPRGMSSIPLSEFRDSAGSPFERRQGIPHRMTVRVKEGFGGEPGMWEW